MTKPTTAELIESFYGEDIYASFVPGDLAADLQGWGGHQFLLKVIEDLKPALVIEVGVWKGRSAIAMAEAMKAAGTPASILCVDTWLGAQEHFDKRFVADLRRRSGYPQLYDQFIFNVIDRGVQDYIVPMPASSLAAAQVLAQRGIKADLIHIDAGHSYAEVRADLEAFWPLLGPDGVMICDDYATWGGVTRAVNEFAAERKLPLIGTQGKALFSASRNLRFNTRLTKIDQGAWKPKRG